MNSEKIVLIIKKIAERIEKEKLFLTELDNAIGDGDHGINLSRGFNAVVAKLDTLTDADPALILKTTGMALVSTVGGASGPLYGTFFMYMGKTLEGKQDITLDDFLVSFKTGIDGVCMRGKAVKGEKTMLDSMIPAYEAMNSLTNINTKEAFEAGFKAASDGVEYTKTIKATKGRASYLGERSIGHQDPGATSFTMMLEEVTKEIN